MELMTTFCFQGGATDDMSSDLDITEAPVTMSVINFVDLAGSERLSQAANDDADKEKLRQKEVCH